jgi:hypothetical protein
MTSRRLWLCPCRKKASTVAARSMQRRRWRTRCGAGVNNSSPVLPLRVEQRVVRLRHVRRRCEDATTNATRTQRKEPLAESQHWTQDINPQPTQSPLYAQTHDVNAFQKALWKSRNRRLRSPPRNQARGRLPAQQPRLDSGAHRESGPAPATASPSRASPTTTAASPAQAARVHHYRSRDNTGDGDSRLAHASLQLRECKYNPEKCAALVVKFTDVTFLLYANNIITAYTNDRSDSGRTHNLTHAFESIIFPSMICRAR